MSQFKPYPAYKESGVEWLGEVPEHWQALALSRVLAVPITDGPHTTPEFLDDGVPFLSVDGIQNGKLYFEGCRYVSFDDHKEFSKKAAPKYNDLLMGKAASVGKIARVTENIEFSIWSPLALIRVDEEKCAAAFLEFCLKSSELQHQILLVSNSNTQLNIGMKDIPKLRIPLPDPHTQTQIARFLDHEAARIDALIEEQQRLIELLKEKRQAVISHAVTKGLDPTVPMKDSGVAWIGGVPAHWDIAPLKHVVSIPITDGPHETPEFIDEGVLFVSAEAVSSGRVDFDKARYISHADHSKYSKKYKPQKHDIYMVKSGATTGVTAIVETDHDFNIWSPLAAIRCRKIYDPYFVLYCMRSRSFQESVVLNWSYGTQQNIGMGVIESLPITSPPLAEQELISCFISEQMIRWNGLIETAVNTVTLLQERRSALISAAVTGKIDVRGWQPPASVSSPVLEEEAV